MEMSGMGKCLPASEYPQSAFHQLESVTIRPGTYARKDLSCGSCIPFVDVPSGHAQQPSYPQSARNEFVDRGLNSGSVRH